MNSTSKNPEIPANNEPNTEPTDLKARNAAISRANGAKSRGPLTPEGKARSARNATKFGFFARTVVLPTESRKRFKRLHDKLRAQIRPANPIETHLFETLVLASWRKLRYSGFETSAIPFEVNRHVADNPQIAGESDITQASVSLQAFCDSSRFLDRLNVLEARCDRQFDRALARLTAVRAGTIPTPELPK